MDQNKSNPKPSWLLAEKDHGQRFFYDNSYISTAFFDTDKIKPLRKTKKHLEKSASIDYLITDDDPTSLLRALESQRLSGLYPNPGNSTRSILEVFASFSHGLDRLFPGGKMSKDLLTSVKACDTIYIILGMNDLLNRLDSLLSDQITQYLKNNNVSSKSMPSEPNELLENLMALAITIYGNAQKPKPRKSRIIRNTKNQKKNSKKTPK